MMRADHTVVAATTIFAGKLKKHTVTCGICATMMEYTMANVFPYNAYHLEEGFVVQCGVCTCLHKCDDLTAEELKGIRHKYQSEINTNCKKNVEWRGHVFGLHRPGEPLLHSLHMLTQQAGHFLHQYAKNQPDTMAALMKVMASKSNFPADPDLLYVTDSNASLPESPVFSPASPSYQR